MCQENEEVLIKQWEDEFDCNKEKQRARTFVICIAIFCMILGAIAVCHADEPTVVQIARQEIGKGEIGGDNKGKEVRKYTRGQEVAWCAAFVSYTLRSAKHSVPYLMSARSYWKVYPHTKRPKPGDVICFYRQGTRSIYGHVGIVEKVTPTTITTIEGNVGKYPAKVKEITYQINHIPHLLGFVRI